nr:RES domain-containing protein [uncultured Flavobacterium sp.]
MTNEIKNICDRIEGFMSSYHENDHELLYAKTMNELRSASLSGIFVKLNNLTLYRVRLNSENNDLFIKTQDLRYAPSKYVCNYGRVNKPGQSMFYCSEFLSICELELVFDYVSKNDIGHERLATNSEWEIKKDLNLLILAIAPSNRELVNGFTLRNECFEFVKSEPDQTKDAYSNFYSLTWHFFEKNAKKDFSVYVVCSAIANYFTLQFPNIDGLVYPSVQGNSGYNIVLRPHVIDNKMIVPKKDLSIKKWIVTNKGSMTIDSSFNKTGKIENDEIIWNN